MTLFSANLTPFLFFRDVNYPTSLQSTTLDGVLSSLLMRNIQNTCGSARYSPNKLNEKLERSVQDGGITVGNHVTIDVCLIPLWGQPF